MELGISITMLNYPRVFVWTMTQQKRGTRCGSTSAKPEGIGMLWVFLISLGPKATVFEGRMTHCRLLQCLAPEAGDFGAAKSWFGGWDDRWLGEIQHRTPRAMAEQTIQWSKGSLRSTESHSWIIFVSLALFGKSSPLVFGKWPCHMTNKSAFPWTRPRIEVGSQHMSIIKNHRKLVLYPFVHIATHTHTNPYVYIIYIYPYR